MQNDSHDTKSIFNWDRIERYGTPVLGVAMFIWVVGKWLLS